MGLILLALAFMQQPPPVHPPVFFRCGDNYCLLDGGKFTILDSVWPPTHVPFDADEREQPIDIRRVLPVPAPPDMTHDPECLRGEHFHPYEAPVPTTTTEITIRIAEPDEYPLDGMCHRSDESIAGPPVH